MTIGIYKIECSITKRIYIGQSIECEVRFKKHIKDLKYNKHCNKLIQKHYNNYGEIFNYEIIETCSVEELNKREIFYIKFYNTYIKYNKDGFNQTRGGSPIFSKKIIKNIYIFDKEGNFLEVCESLKETSEKYNIKKSLIGESIKRKGLCRKKYYFNYENKFDYFLKDRNVYVFDKNGTLLSKHKYFIDCDKHYGFGIGTTKETFKYKGLYKNTYYFNLEDKFDYIKKYKKCKQIALYDLNGDLFKVFKNVEQTTNFLNITNDMVKNTNIYPTENYYIRYVNNNKILKKIDLPNFEFIKLCYLYDENKNFIREFKSINEASIFFNMKNSTFSRLLRTNNYIRRTNQYIYREKL